MTLSAGTRVRVTVRGPHYGREGRVLEGSGPYRVRLDAGGVLWLPGSAVEAF